MAQRGGAAAAAGHEAQPTAPAGRPPRALSPRQHRFARDRGSSTTTGAAVRQEGIINKLEVEAARMAQEFHRQQMAWEEREIQLETFACIHVALA